MCRRFDPGPDHSRNAANSRRREVRGFFYLLIQLAEDAAADVKGMGFQVVAFGGADDFDDEK